MKTNNFEYVKIPKQLFNETFSLEELAIICTLYSLEGRADYEEIHSHFMFEDYRVISSTLKKLINCGELKKENGIYQIIEN